MRYQVVLDGLHFPHILDTIFDGMSIATLARASQVCQQWRVRVKSMCRQVALYTSAKELHPIAPPHLELRTGHSIGYTELVEDKKARVFLTFCECFWTDAPMECCEHEIMTAFNPRLLSNLTLFRTWDDISDDCGGGLHTLHVKTHVTRPSICACRGWLVSHVIPRVVFTVHWMTWEMHLADEGSSAFPRSSESLTIIYLLNANTNPTPPGEPDMHDPYWHFIGHWHSFNSLVERAWSKGITVTVVNAPSLEDLPVTFDPYDDLEYPPWPESAMRFIRQRAIRAVVGDDDATPPGPVCPVHFVTLEEYRAHVGEVEYAMHTDPGWIPRAPGQV